MPVIMLLFASTIYAAPPTVTGLYPAGGQRGINDGPAFGGGGAGCPVFGIVPPPTLTFAL